MAAEEELVQAKAQLFESTERFQVWAANTRYTSIREQLLANYDVTVDDIGPDELACLM